MSVITYKKPPIILLQNNGFMFDMPVFEHRYY